MELRNCSHYRATYKDSVTSHTGITWDTEVCSDCDRVLDWTNGRIGRKKAGSNLLAAYNAMATAIKKKDAKQIAKIMRWMNQELGKSLKDPKIKGLFAKFQSNPKDAKVVKEFMDSLAVHLKIKKSADQTFNSQLMKEVTKSFQMSSVEDITNSVEDIIDKVLAESNIEKMEDLVDVLSITEEYPAAIINAFEVMQRFYDLVDEDDPYFDEFQNIFESVEQHYADYMAYLDTGGPENDVEDDDF